MATPDPQGTYNSMLEDLPTTNRMRFGAFIAPYHSLTENPTLAIARDMRLVRHLDDLTYDEVWIGEHHSAGMEIISSPEMFIAAAAERTRRIRFGSGVNSLPYHHPLVLADRYVQLDHQTQGRVMLGVGPGQLASDASMMGIEISQQRRMMVESLESILQLLEGQVVSRETDWFKLRSARLHLRPVQRPRMEVAVAAAVTPAGPSLAGRLGLSMLSIAASTAAGFSVLPNHWQVYQDEMVAGGRRPDRSTWRVVAPMHLAPTREQAWAEAKENALGVAQYFQRLLGDTAPASLKPIKTPEEAMRLWTTEGFPFFGVVMAGTPDDAVEYIRRVHKQAGGFGTFLLLAHNCASTEATLRSYDLFARFVMPHFQDLNSARESSLVWCNANAVELLEQLAQRQRAATEEYEGKRDERLRSHSSDKK
jgi:limonene 1,2-monooxygenase